MSHRRRVIAIDLWAWTLLALALAGGCATQKPRDPVGPSFTVMTFNVYYGMQRSPEPMISFTEARAKSTIAAIDESGADIVVVQEADDTWWKYASDKLPSQYPNTLMKRDRRGGGFVVLSRWPFEMVEHIPPADDEIWHAALLLLADTPMGQVRLLCVHLTPPLEADGTFTPEALLRSEKIREREMNYLCPIVSDEAPAIVLGDFNEGDGGDAIRCLEHNGFTNALPMFRPMTDTWKWPLAGPIGLGRRLDHVLFTEHLRPVNAWAIDADGTDHRAVLVTFERDEDEWEDYLEDLHEDEDDDDD